MIQVEGPGGVVIEFPEGTPPEKIKAAMAKQFGGKPQAPAQPTAAPQGYLSGMLDSVTDGITMGFGDEMRGVASAALGRNNQGEFFDYSRPFNERYGSAVLADRQRQDAFAEENPISAGLGSMGGAVATGLGASRLGLSLMGRAGAALAPNASATSRVLSRVPPVAAAGLEGAGYGALYGAGSADEGNRLEGAAYGGVVGGIAGGAIGAVTRALSGRNASRAARAAAPSLDDLKRAENTAWRAADARNPTILGADSFAQQARQVLSQEGFDPLSHPKVARALDILDERIAANPAQSWKEVNAFRRHVSEEIVNGGGAVSNGERRLGKALRQGLDNWVEQTSPVPEAVVARELTGRVKRSEALNKALYKAENTTNATGSGGNINNEMLKKLRDVLNNDRLRAQFTPDDIRVMEETLRDTQRLGPNALRTLGKLSPSGNGLMAALGLGATAMNPLMAAAPAVGMVAKALSDRGTARAFQSLEAGVRAGSQFQPNQPRQLSPAVQSVIRALSAQGGALTQP